MNRKSRLPGEASAKTGGKAEGSGSCPRDHKKKKPRRKIWRIIGVMLIIGYPFILDGMPQVFRPLVRFIALWPHFENISKGVIDSRDVFYYASLIGFSLYLNVLSLESRKWR